MKRGLQPGLINPTIAPWFLPKLKEVGMLAEPNRKPLLAIGLLKIWSQLPQRESQRWERYPVRIAPLPGDTICFSEQPE